MHSLNVLESINDDAIVKAAMDEKRPVLERAKMWLGTGDANFALACELLHGLVERCEELEAEKKERVANMIWWYKNQINPIRKALGLTEMDYILDPVLALKARCEKREARNVDNSD